MISIEGLAHHQIVDKILHDSYQIDAAILVSETSDQSIMVTKLPPSKFKPVEEQTTLTSKDFLEEMKINFLQLFDQHHTDTYDLKMGFEGLGFQFLGGRQAKFQCNCSKERVIQSILSLGNISLDDLFKDDKRIKKISFIKDVDEYLKDLGINTDIPRGYDTATLDKIVDELKEKGIDADHDAAMDVS